MKRADSASSLLLNSSSDTRWPYLSIDLRRVLIVGGGLLFLLVVVFALWDTWYLRNQAQARSEDNLANLARALAGQTVSMLGSVDLVLREAGDIAARRFARSQPALLHGRLEQGFSRLPLLHDVMVFDASGRPVLQPDASGVRTGRGLLDVPDASDQPYFSVHRDAPSVGLTITTPTSNGVAIVVSRRISGGNDQFGGVVAAVLDQAYVERFYRAIELGGGGAVLLLRRDGVLLAHYPETLGTVGTKFSSGLELDQALGKNKAGVMEIRSPIGGRLQLVALEPVHGFPLMVSIAMDKQFALRGWRQQTWHITVRTIVLASVVGALIAILLRQLGLREQSERRLRESEERYALAMAGSNEGHWDWSLESGRLYVSGRLQSILGTGDCDAITHRKQFESKLLVHADDITRVRRTQRAHLEGRTPYYECEYRARYGSGRYRWFLVRGLALRDSKGRPYRMSGSTSDITDRKQAEEQLRVQSALLDELFESAPEGIVLLDEEHKVMRANREFTRMFGYTPGEMDGRSLIELIVPPELVDETRALLLQARQDQRVSAETLRARKDGSRVNVSILGAPIYVGGSRIATFVIFRDITERRQAESERSRLEQRLRQAEKLEALGTMAGGIAHDFNNILGAILGYGTMALNAASEGSALKRYTGSVMTAANRAKSLVDQILTFSRNQGGRRTVVCVSSVIHETLEMVRVSLPQTVDLLVHDRARSATVICDPAQIHQLVMNLCTNAIHAMSKGGRLEVQLDALETQTESQLSHGVLAPGHYVRLSVCDTGHGMAPPLLERIFEPFFTTKAAGSGTGLGLALVHATVSDLGGAIELQSQPGAGSKFEIYLPRADTVRDEAPTSELRPPQGNGARVLLVEDEKPLMLLEEEMVAALGYDVSGFTRAQEALELFAADPSAFDAVITDQLMPQMKGTDLARRLHELQADVPVILMSGYRGPMLNQEAMAAGIRELLTKPLDSRQLGAALARTIQAS